MLRERDHTLRRNFVFEKEIPTIRGARFISLGESWRVTKNDFYYRDEIPPVLFWLVDISLSSQTWVPTLKWICQNCICRRFLDICHVNRLQFPSTRETGLVEAGQRIPDKKPLTWRGIRVSRRSGVCAPDDEAEYVTCWTDWSGRLTTPSRLQEALSS